MSSESTLARLKARFKDADARTRQDSLALVAFLESIPANSPLLDRTVAQILGLTEWELMAEVPSLSFDECRAGVSALASEIAPKTATALSLVQSLGRVSSGLGPLDEILHGGLRKGHLTEIVGRAGTGKSHFCMTMTARVCAQGKSVVYFDTERKFAADRFSEIVIGQGGHPQHALKAFVMRVSNKTCDQFFQDLKALESTLVEKDVGLIVVDSIAAIARLDNVSVVERQSLLAKIASQLKILAEAYQLPVVVTNQMLEISQPNEGSALVAALGNTWHHVVNVRLALSIVQPCDERMARVTKSPDTMEASVDFEIDRNGIVARDPVKAALRREKELEMMQLM